MRVIGRCVQQLRAGAGSGSDRPRRHLRPRLPAATGDADRRDHAPARADLQGQLQRRAGHRVTQWSGSDRGQTLSAGEWTDTARILQDEGWLLVDLCGLDRLGLSDEAVETRFEVVVQLIHHDKRERTTVHVGASGEPPTVPSVTELWAGADHMEREAFDLMGIHFEGHPNLTRILMPDEWEGHPLRKDYGVGKVPVEFIPQPLLQIDSAGQSPNAEGAHQAIDHLGQGSPDGGEIS
ncbi:MAG: hypothetical protein GEU71_05110 [Actinobacteria bacterium]|nr:hypothetical protein [Actinomycetota bacterium]